MEKGFSQFPVHQQNRVVRLSAGMMALGMLCSASSLIAFAASADAQAAESISQSTQNKSLKAAEHVSGELIVKLKDENGQKALSVLKSALVGIQILDVEPFVTDQSLQKVKIAQDKQLDDAIRVLNAHPSVAYAEPNFIYRASLQQSSQPSVQNDVDGAPNDPDFGKLWGLKNTGQADSAGQVGVAGADINVLPLWKKGITGSKDVVVAVIDTGVAWDHPDLVDNLYTNPGEAGPLANNGKDDDGNGFIDDVHGWNFNSKNNNSRDDHNHGTHCAGTIGATGNNTLGVAGVNWKVSILPVKFLSSSGGGTLQDAVESINYARSMKVNIMSNSWGGGGFSQALADAIKGAHEAGILFVAAAGNDGNNNDNSPTYPASYEFPNVVAVAATDNRDQKASFSNYGTKRVHVAAPGVKVYSTLKDKTYGAFSGTSMACPHVAGAAALLLSANPDWDYNLIKERLIKTSQPVRALRKQVMAKGRIDLNNAYHNIVPPSEDPDESLWKTVEQVIESPHPYSDNANLKFPVNYPGAKYIRVIFDKVDVEQKYDNVIVEDAAGASAEELTGTVANHTSEYVKGDSLVVRLKSDGSVTKWGFKISKIQVIKD